MAIMTQNELDFLHFYMEQTSEEMRHVENLREKIAAMIVTLSLAIGGFVIQQKFADQYKPLIIFMCILGLFGILMSHKLYQLHQEGQSRLNKWYELLKTEFNPSCEIFRARDIGDQENVKRFSVVSKIRHNRFWIMIYVFIIIGGIFFYFQKPIEEIKNIPPYSTTTIILKNPTVLDTLYQSKDTIHKK